VRWIGTVIREIFDLFVDDSSFAIAILIWLGAFWLFVPRFALPSWLKGVILFAGLSAILVESTLRRAKSRNLTRSGKKQRAE
jgi:membrane protein implicated in regulation of membrane protease activity